MYIQNDSDLIERDESSSSTRKHFVTNTGFIDVLIKAYDQAESWQTKRQILSLFVNDFSRRELQTLIPGLTKWRIDQARQHATEAGKTIFRKTIDQGSVDHFISYISQPQVHQDVAFGTKTLKLDSGQRIIIPGVMRTLIPSRIIEQYTRYCREKRFEHRCRGPFMSLITSQRKELKHLTTCVQLSTLKWKTGPRSFGLKQCDET